MELTEENQDFEDSRPPRKSTIVTHPATLAAIQDAVAAKRAREEEALDYPDCRPVRRSTIAVPEEIRELLERGSGPKRIEPKPADDEASARPEPDPGRR